MPFLLYTASAAILLWLTHRLVLRLSRGAASVLFLLPCVFVGFALLTSRVYAPVDHAWDTVPLNWMKEQYGLVAAHNGYLSDISTQMLPWREAVRASLARGEWPLWNRSMLAGDILAQSASPAAYSPFTLIACLLPAAVSMTFSAAISHLLAAVSAFVLARQLGCREWPSLVAAAGFTYATTMAFYVLWPQAIGWALLPLALAAVHRGSVRLLTVAFTLLLLSGHPETALHVVTVTAAWTICVQPWRGWLRLSIAGVAALLISAIYLLPLLEAVPQTHESVSRSKVYANVPRGEESREVLARLATDLFPALHTRIPQMPVDTAAVGSIILALAIYGAARTRTRASWFLCGLVVFGLLARAGWKPLARLMQELPLFELSLNERFSFAAAMALAILAALGVEQLMARSRDRAAAITLSVAMAVMFAANLWIARAGLPPPTWGRYRGIAEVAGLAVAVVLILVREPKFLLLAILAQRFASEGGIYRSLEQRLAYPPIPMLASLQNVREPFRITGHGVALIPAAATFYGLEDVRGNQALTFRRTFETFPLWSIHQPVWFNRVDDLTRPFLSFLNVRYAITWDREPPPPGWREVSRQRGSMLIENLRALPRAFVPHTVRLGRVALTEMATETDFAARAWIEAPGLPGEYRNGPGAVVTRNANLGYELDVTMENHGWVVTSLPHWKGWRASIHGYSVPTHFANHAFLSVRVPRGRHRVTLTYLPESFVVGRAVTFLSLLACAVYLWRGR